MLSGRPEAVPDFLAHRLTNAGLQKVWMPGAGPSAQTAKAWDTWWLFGSDFFTQFLRVMGFSCHTTTYATQQPPGELFTVVATKEQSSVKA